MSEPVDTAYFLGPGVSTAGSVKLHNPTCNILYMVNRGTKPSYIYPPGKNHPTYARTAVPQLPHMFYTPRYPGLSTP